MTVSSFEFQGFWTYRSTAPVATRINPLVLQQEGMGGINQVFDRAGVAHALATWPEWREFRDRKCWAMFDRVLAWTTREESFRRRLIDQAGLPQHFEMPTKGRATYRKDACQFPGPHRFISKQINNLTPGRVRQGGKNGVNVISHMVNY